MSEGTATGQPTFSTRLHELRTAELRRLPAEAKTVLHGGASAAWYFRWFEQAFPGIVERHVAVEAFGEEPEDLPENVEWLRRTLGDMAPVPSAAIDLVFAGQVIEHLWAEDVADFLLESHRVLRPGGQIALDSPNRSVTEAIAWRQPEHTVEFSVDEIETMMTLAGFEVEELRGVLLGYDRARHTFLQLEDDRMPWEQRAKLAEDRPEDSFVWWVLARRSERPGDAAALREFTSRKLEEFRARRLSTPASPLPIRRARELAPHVSAPATHSGTLLSGPCFPVDSGAWEVSLLLRRDGEGFTSDAPIASISVVSHGEVHHAHRDLRIAELDRRGRWTRVSLGFTLPAMAMGVEVRLIAHGNAAISAQTTVALQSAADFAIPDAGTIDRVGLAEPRTVEMVQMLARRAAAKTHAAVRR